MKTILAYMKPYIKYAFMAIGLALLEVGSDLMQPTLIKKIIDEGVYRQDIHLTIQLGGLMFLVAFLGMIGGFGCVYAAASASQQFGADVRHSVFSKVQNFSFDNIDHFGTSSLITRLTNDVTALQNLVQMSLRLLVRAPLMCAGGIIAVFLMNRNLSLVLLIQIPLLVVLILTLMKKGFPLFQTVQKRLDKVNSVMQENLSGIRVVKAFVGAKREESRFGVANEGLSDITIKASRIMSLMMPGMMLIMNVGTVFVLWFGGHQVSANTMQIGEIVAITNYLTQILFSLMLVSMFLMQVSRAEVSANRVEEVLLAKPTIQEKEGAVVKPISKGDIVFDHVSYGYQSAKGNMVLKDLSFTLRAGETVGVIGMTGAGKTTLINLIARLYEVTEGAIVIDGKDIRNYSTDTLRKSLGMVLQDTVLFSGTIKENILWGQPQATEQEMIQAAQDAEAHGFITTFPEGYDTIVGQRGVTLSGGQKQRISLARALIRKPIILVLDDSTSAVDMTTEAQILNALKERYAKATSIIIAQRITSVMEADKILVVEDGVLVGMGAHEELLKTCEHYQSIYESQKREEEAV